MADRLPTENQSPSELKRQIELEREGRPFVVFRGEGEQLVIVPLTEGTMLIGRTQPDGISLPWDSGVSHLHAELHSAGDEWLIVDDGLSRNGTFVNGERVVARRRLRDRDLLRCGRTLIFFRNPAGTGREDTVMAADSPPDRITDTQRRVLIALCRPLSAGSSFAAPATNKAIADELYLSIDAVKSHLRALFEIFGVGDLPQNTKRTALAEHAVRSGTVTPRDLAAD
jgi:pSer/pThr/pTyr-binding forkhead associated (FHA) protein